ncbi:MAG: hypothetical protein ABI647_14590 [Gemmatimonadota bacterium]
MDPGVADCSSAVPGRHERPHQPYSTPGVERILSYQLLAPIDRRGVITALFIGERKLLESLSVEIRVSSPLPVGPPLEFTRVIEEETLEKWPAVNGCCGGRIAPTERVLELADIAQDHGWIEPDGVGSEEYAVPQLAPKCGKELLERMPTTVRGSVGPEKADQTISRDSPFSSHRDER